MKKQLTGIGILLVCIVLLSSMAFVRGKAEAKEKRHYYYCGAVNAHPYFLDTWLGIDYAKEVFDSFLIFPGCTNSAMYKPAPGWSWEPRGAF